MAASRRMAESCQYERGGSHADEPHLDVAADMPLPRDVIVGHVQLVDCIRDSESRWAEPGMWHWLLVNPVALDVPVPARGKL